MVSQPKPRKARHPLEIYLGYQLRRAATHMQADLAMRISDLGLTMVEMSTLLVIEANPGVTQSEIGRMIAIKRANMAPLAAGLQAKGLITSTPVDKRSNGLNLTAKGAEIVAAIHLRVEENENLLFRRFTPKERAGLVAQVRRIWAEDDPI
jgi:DNA-binding MarR family transcriptional regulator